MDKVSNDDHLIHIVTGIGFTPVQALAPNVDKVTRRTEKTFRLSIA